MLPNDIIMGISSFSYKLSAYIPKAFSYLSNKNPIDLQHSFH